MDSVEICNMALGMLGMPFITSFGDNNNHAQLCKRFFPALRDRVLRDHNWSFATKFCELQQLNVTSPDPRYAYVCGLPGDILRIVELIDGRPYRRIGRKIFVRELPATLVYTARIEDPELFDDTFTEALQYLVAAEIGMAHTRDAQLANLHRQEYERILAVARSIDSQENRHAAQNSPPRSFWLTGRGRNDDCRPVKWTEGNAGKQSQ